MSIFTKKYESIVSAVVTFQTRLNDLSHGIKIWTDFSSVLSQCTCLTDRQTERQLSYR